jgi:hypothetical protein
MDLISPELDFALFCRRLARADFREVLDAAGMECALIHRDYRQRTGRSLRAGSRRARYRDDLLRLTSMLINGVYPSHCEDDFFAAVAPMMVNLLTKWTIGDLGKVFSLENIEIKDKEAAKSDPLLATVLEARDAGRKAAQAASESWRAANPEREYYDYMAIAVLHLIVRTRSPLGKRLMALAEGRPYLLRIDRGYGSPAGVVVSILNMANTQWQTMNIAAEEAALAVLETRLGVTGYVTSYES